MKSKSLLYGFFFLVMSLFLLSCNAGGDKNTSSSTTPPAETTASNGNSPVNPEGPPPGSRTPPVTPVVPFPTNGGVTLNPLVTSGTTQLSRDGLYALHLTENTGSTIARGQLEVVGSKVSAVLKQGLDEWHINTTLNQTGEFNLVTPGQELAIAGSVLSNGSLLGNYSGSNDFGVVNGFRYTDIQRLATQYDGLYQVSFKQDVNLVSQGFIRIQYGVFQSTFQTNSNQIFLLGGQVFAAGEVLLGSVRLGDLMIRGKGKINSDFSISGTYSSDVGDGELTATRLQENALSEIDLKVVNLTSSTKVRAVAATANGERLLVMKQNPTSSRVYDQIVLESANGMRGVILIGENGLPSSMEIPGYHYDFTGYSGATVDVKITDGKGSTTTKNDMVFDRLTRKRQTRLFAQESQLLIQDAAIMAKQTACSLAKDVVAPSIGDGWLIVAFGCESILLNKLVSLSVDDLKLRSSSSVPSGEEEAFDVLSRKNTPPQNTKLTINRGAELADHERVTLQISGTDDSGVIAYYLSETETPPNPYSPLFQKVSPSKSFAMDVPYTVSSVGLGRAKRGVYLWLLDSQLTLSEKAFAEITIETNDSQSPTGQSMMIENGSSSTPSPNVTISLSATDNNTIVAYYLSENQTSPTPKDPNWIYVKNPRSTFNQNVPFVLTSGEQARQIKSVYAWFKDKSSNISTLTGQTQDTISLEPTDSTPPTNVQVTINHGAEVSDSVFVELSLVAQDNIGVVAYYVSEKTDTPDPSSPEWKSIPSSVNYSRTIPFILRRGDSANAPRYVFVWFKDAAGYLSEGVSDHIFLNIPDTSSGSFPSTVAINNGSASTSLVKISVTLEAGNQNKVQAYYVSESPVLPANNGSVWEIIPPVSSFAKTFDYVLSPAATAGSHQRTLYAWFQNRLGQITTAASDSINLVVEEVTPPVGKELTVNGGVATSASADVNIKLIATDNKAVTGYYISQNPVTPTQDNPEWKTVNPPQASFTLQNSPFHLVVGDGASSRASLYAWLRDAGGNISEVLRTSIMVTPPDTSPPQNVSAIMQSVSGTKDFVTIALSADDNVGVTGFFLSDSSQTPTVSSTWAEVPAALHYANTAVLQIDAKGVLGLHEVTRYVWFRDLAGNVSLPVTVKSQIQGSDKVAPTEVALKINNGAAKTETREVQLNLKAKDNVGVFAYFLSEQPIQSLGANAPGWQNVTAQSPNYEATIPYTFSLSPYAGSYAKKLFLAVKDSAGNITILNGSAGILLVVPDALVPKTTSVAINQGASTTSSARVEVSFVGSSPDDLIQYFVSTTSQAPGSNDSGWTTIGLLNPAISTTVTQQLETATSIGAHEKTVCVWLKNSKGYISQTSCDTITFNVQEKVPPFISEFVVNEGEPVTTLPRVAIKVRVLDETEVAAYYFSQINKSPNAAGDNVSGGWIPLETFTRDFKDEIIYPLTPEALPGVYPKEVFTWFKDSVGNVTVAQSTKIAYVVEDNIKPSASNIALVAQDGDGNSLKEGDVTTSMFPTVKLQFTLQDNIGVSAFYVSEDPKVPDDTASNVRCCWLVVPQNDSGVPITSYTDVVDYMFTHPYLALNERPPMVGDDAVASPAARKRFERNREELIAKEEQTKSDHQAVLLQEAQNPAFETLVSQAATNGVRLDRGQPLGGVKIRQTRHFSFLDDAGGFFSDVGDVACDGLNGLADIGGMAFDFVEDTWNTKGQNLLKIGYDLGYEVYKALNKAVGGVIDAAFHAIGELASSALDATCAGIKGTVGKGGKIGDSLSDGACSFFSKAEGFASDVYLKTAGVVGGFMDQVYLRSAPFALCYGAMYYMPFKYRKAIAGGAVKGAKAIKAGTLSAGRSLSTVAKTTATAAGGALKGAGTIGLKTGIAVGVGGGLAFGTIAALDATGVTNLNVVDSLTGAVVTGAGSVKDAFGSGSDFNVDLTDAPAGQSVGSGSSGGRSVVESGIQFTGGAVETIANAGNMCVDEFADKGEKPVSQSHQAIGITEIGQWAVYSGADTVDNQITWAPPAGSFTQKCLDLWKSNNYVVPIDQLGVYFEGELRQCAVGEQERSLFLSVRDLVGNTAPAGQFSMNQQIPDADPPTFTSISMYGDQGDEKVTKGLKVVLQLSAVDLVGVEYYAVGEVYHDNPNTITKELIDQCTAYKQEQTFSLSNTRSSRQERKDLIPLLIGGAVVLGGLLDKIAGDKDRGTPDDHFATKHQKTGCNEANGDLSCKCDGVPTWQPVTRDPGQSKYQYLAQTYLQLDPKDLAKEDNWTITDVCDRKTYKQIRRVYAWFKDNAGNMSRPVPDPEDKNRTVPSYAEIEIQLDPEPPKNAEVVVDEGALKTIKNAVDLHVSASDNDNNIKYISIVQSKTFLTLDGLQRQGLKPAFTPDNIQKISTISDNFSICDKPIWIDLEGQGTSALDMVLDDVPICSSSYGTKWFYVWFADDTSSLGQASPKIIAQPAAAMINYVPDSAEEMVLMRANNPNSYLMGATFRAGVDESKDEVKNEIQDEKQGFNVTLTKDFFISRQEVSVQQFRQCVDEEGCDFPGNKTNPPPNQNFLSSEGTARDEHPVNYVTRANVDKYIAWKNAREPGAGYRLCTEAEWEYAAREAGQTTTRWGCGDLDSTESLGIVTLIYPACVSERIWSRNATGASSTNLTGPKTLPVRSVNYQHLVLGLFHMEGNVDEYVSDFYESHAVDAFADPLLIDPVGPLTGTSSVVRGGNYDSILDGVRLSSRRPHDPNVASSLVGFRVCSDHKPPSIGELDNDATIPVLDAVLTGAGVTNVGGTIQALNTPTFKVQVTASDSQSNLRYVAIKIYDTPVTAITASISRVPKGSIPDGNEWVDLTQAGAVTSSYSGLQTRTLVGEQTGTRYIAVWVADESRNISVPKIIGPVSFVDTEPPLIQAFGRTISTSNVGIRMGIKVIDNQTLVRYIAIKEFSDASETIPETIAFSAPGTANSPWKLISDPNYVAQGTITTGDGRTQNPVLYQGQELYRFMTVPGTLAKPIRIAVWYADQLGNVTTTHELISPVIQQDIDPPSAGQIELALLKSNHNQVEVTFSASDAGSCPGYVAILDSRLLSFRSSGPVFDAQGELSDNWTEITDTENYVLNDQLICEYRGTLIYGLKSGIHDGNQIFGDVYTMSSGETRWISITFADRSGNISPSQSRQKTVTIPSLLKHFGNLFRQSAGSSR